MIGATATVSEMQNDFGRYLDMVLNGHEVIVTKNGEEVGRFIPKDFAPLTDSLRGVLNGRWDLDEARDEELRKKYEIAD